MPMLDLAPAAREVARLLDGVADDQLADPTPCAGTPVAALIDHLMGLSLAFTWPARKTTPVASDTNPSREPADAEHLDPYWRTQLPRRLSELVERGATPRRGRG